MAARADAHHHCRVCGNVCGPSEKFCSAKCETERNEQLRSRRTLQTVMYAAGALLLIVLLIELSH